jgi:hypothetical protein
MTETTWALLKPLTKLLRYATCAHYHDGFNFGLMLMTEIKRSEISVMLYGRIARNDTKQREWMCLWRMPANVLLVCLTAGCLAILHAVAREKKLADHEATAAAHGVHDLDAALRLLLVHEEAGSEVMLSTDVSSCLGCSRRVY